MKKLLFFVFLVEVVNAAIVEDKYTDNEYSCALHYRNNDWKGYYIL